MSTSPSDMTAEEISRHILLTLHRYRRTEATADTGEQRCKETPCAACFASHQAKLEKFVERDEQIQFVLPAFPAKSPNRRKVLGELPDLGEQMALEFLQSLCDHISHFYQPGARITICSDGHVFGDVVGVSDESVTAYRESLEAMIQESNWNSLELFGLDDAFDSKNYPKLRQVLSNEYAATIEELRQRISTEETTRALFNGIHRFMFEDATARHTGELSKSQLRKQSKEAAYQTILRSNAWSGVVGERFPDAVRLSIHPQRPHSEKFGLHLLRTQDGWLTPWHGVVLDDGVTLSLVKRWDAEKLGATVVYRNGRPSHFVAPHLTLSS